MTLSLRRATGADVPYLVGLLGGEDVAPFLAAVRAFTHEAVAEEVERSEREPDAFGVLVVELDLLGDRLVRERPDGSEDVAPFLAAEEPDEVGHVGPRRPAERDGHRAGTSAVALAARRSTPDPRATPARMRPSPARAAAVIASSRSTAP